MVQGVGADMPQLWDPGVGPELCDVQDIFSPCTYSSWNSNSIVEKWLQKVTDWTNDL